MPTITIKEGTVIYCKDWGTGQPVVFSHGWPLSTCARMATPPATISPAATRRTAASRARGAA
jgi:hypothetical protein